MIGPVASGPQATERRRPGRLRPASLSDGAPVRSAMSTVIIGCVAVNFDLPASLVECIEVVEFCRSLNRDNGLMIVPQE